MDYEEVQYKKDSVIIKNVKNYNIKQIVECGQCFRWDKISDCNYIGVAYGKVIEVLQEQDNITIFNSNEEDFNNIWVKYFDLDRDYSKIKDNLENDVILSESIKYGYGIRILNQEPFEMLISFIISARNSIPSIMKTIKKIAESYGRPIEYKGNTYYSFPKPEEIKDATLDMVKETGASFRSKYLIDTIEKINEGSSEYDLNNISTLSADECHIALQIFKGVGAKVADCIMLFSMGKTSAFPVDVWVKRAMIHYYKAEDESLSKIRVFGREKFGELSGFAQQYLFYNARENKIKI